MAYVKQGPWAAGDPLSSEQLTAMDNGIADASTSVLTDLGAVSGTVTIDPTVADTYVMSLAGDATIAVAHMNEPGVLRRVALFITLAGHTVSFDSSIVFASGIAPTLAGDPDQLDLVGLAGGSTTLAAHVAAY